MQGSANSAGPKVQRSNKPKPPICTWLGTYSVDWIPVVHGYELGPIMSNRLIENDFRGSRSQLEREWSRLS